MIITLYFVSVIPVYFGVIQRVSRILKRGRHKSRLFLNRSAAVFS